MATQAHHLIPQNVVRDHPLFKAMRASGMPFNGFTLDLPDRATAAAATAAAQAGDMADAAHEGRHWKAYDRMVGAYLDAFAIDYAERDGFGGFRLQAGVDINALTNSLKSLEVCLADWHTATVGTDGKVAAPVSSECRGRVPRAHAASGRHIPSQTRNTVGG